MVLKNEREVPLTLAAWLRAASETYINRIYIYHVTSNAKSTFCPEQGVKLLGLLLTGSTGQHMAGRNGLA
jgi:hypothetical protein